MHWVTDTNPTDQPHDRPTYIHNYTYLSIKQQNQPCEPTSTYIPIPIYILSNQINRPTTGPAWLYIHIKLPSNQINSVTNPPTLAISVPRCTPPSSIISISGPTAARILGSTSIVAGLKILPWKSELCKSVNQALISILCRHYGLIFCGDSNLQE